jgi:HPt (histidine-containing phosphotransfer) domain-containing protein
MPGHGVKNPSRFGNGRIQSLGAPAHTLKGASANVGAEGIHRAAAALETDACGGDLLLAAEHFEILRVEMDLLFSELQSAWGDEKHSFSKEPTKDL